MTTQQPSASALTASIEELDRWRATYRHGYSLTHDELAKVFATARAYHAARAELDAERRRRVAFFRALRDIDMAYWDSRDVFEKAENMLAIANNALRADESAIIAADDAGTEGNQP